MKRLNILALFVAGLFAFTSCSDDKENPAINSLTNSDGTPISFVLNAPNNTAYTLIPENAKNIIDILTCKQPAYGFDAAVKYTIQICAANNGFAKAVDLATVVDGESIPVKTFELNDAMNSLGMVDAKVAYNIDIRLKAIVNSSVAPLYSNVVSMAVNPYSGARTQVYFVGAIFGNGWDNNSPEMRMFADNDINDMTYTYTGKVLAGSEFKIIQNPGKWDVQWGLGASAGVLASKDAGNIKGDFSADGYYTMKFDLSKLTYSVTPYTGALTEYNQLSLVGGFNEWGKFADIDLTQTSYDKHIWINTAAVIPADGELKIRADHKWDVSFGGSNGLWKEKQGQFAKFDGGDNVKVAAGTYFIKFNDITKHIIMIKK